MTLTVSKLAAEVGIKPDRPRRHGGPLGAPGARPARRAGGLDLTSKLGECGDEDRPVGGPVHLARTVVTHHGLRDLVSSVVDQPSP